MKPFEAYRKSKKPQEPQEEPTIIIPRPATIVEVELRPSFRDKDATNLHLQVQLDTPIEYDCPFCGETKGMPKFYATISNSPRWEWSYKRAELREALGYQPIIFTYTHKAPPEIIIPLILPQDLDHMVGKKIMVVIDETSFEGIPRRYVSHILPYMTIQEEPPNEPRE